MRTSSNTFKSSQSVKDKKNSTSAGNNHSTDRGCLRIIGLGPGGREYITPRAIEALRDCDTVIGYKRYAGFVQDLLSGKEVIVSGMRAEKERVGEAIESAQQGRHTALLSSGDAGVYGMAGLVFEMLSEGDTLPVEVIPGITAAQSAAACLGAPLMNDYAVLSLSDLMTPLNIIERRACACAEGDLVTVLYNPKSNTRTEPFEKVINIFKTSRTVHTPVGVVRNALRFDQQVTITDLAGIKRATVDMLSIVIIGNSCTEIRDGRLITRRGYFKSGSEK